MKKLFTALIFTAVAIFSVQQVQAEPRTIDLTTATTLSTTGASNVTTNISAVAGRRIVLWGLYGTSDKSGSVVTIARANATGVTGNYTAKATFAVGAASLNLLNNTVPLYVADTGYAIRLTLDSTTKNNIIANYQYE